MSIKSGFHAYSQSVVSPAARPPLKPEKQPDRAEKWRKERNKSEERKTGHDVPRMINFRSQVARRCSLELVFPLAVGQSLLTFSIFLARSRSPAVGL